MCLKLRKGAIFIADAHYPNHKKKEFISFLYDIKYKKIIASQLILMGDIFDLLVGESKYLENRFKKEIYLLEDIAKDIEVIYLEGNHDFNLKKFFKRVKVFPIKKQPLILKYNNKTYALSHGDKFNTPLIYKTYTKIIRNPLILKIIPDFFAKKQLLKMKNKKICKKIINFKNIIHKITQNYKSDYIIEAHFHQGTIIKNYISLPSFACSLKYAILQENIDFINYKNKL